MSKSVSSHAISSGDNVADHRSSDAVLIDLLRKEEHLAVAELASRLRVTATAVRQRLDRLMKDGLIERITLPQPQSAGAPA